jgi:lycopene cyclase domain-containing protein
MKWNYFLHLMLWATPCLALQWVFGWRIFRANLRAVFAPAMIGGTFFSVCDSFAVRSGIWIFDANQILGVHIGPLPIEEVLFFYITSLLVSQSLVLFLPESLRR